MKYLIIALILSACGREGISPGTKQSIIQSIEVRDDNKKLCYYFGDGGGFATEAPLRFDFKVCDSCGKFQIGDTIKFTK